MEVKQIIETLFYATFPIIGALLVFIFKTSLDTLRNLEKSVEDLNINIAVIVEKTANHEKRIEKLEDKIS